MDYIVGLEITTFGHTLFHISTLYPLLIILFIQISGKKKKRMSSQYQTLRKSLLWQRLGSSVLFGTQNVDKQTWLDTCDVLIISYIWKIPCFFKVYHVFYHGYNYILRSLYQLSAFFIAYLKPFFFSLSIFLCLCLFSCLSMVHPFASSVNFYVFSVIIVV